MEKEELNLYFAESATHSSGPQLGWCGTPNFTAKRQQRPVSLSPRVFVTFFWLFINFLSRSVAASSPGTRLLLPWINICLHPSEIICQILSLSLIWASDSVGDSSAAHTRPCTCNFWWRRDPHRISASLNPAARGPVARSQRKNNRLFYAVTPARASVAAGGAPRQLFEPLSLRNNNWHRVREAHTC